MCPISPLQITGSYRAVTTENLGASGVDDYWLTSELYLVTPETRSGLSSKSGRMTHFWTFLNECHDPGSCIQESTSGSPLNLGQSWEDDTLRNTIKPIVAMKVGLWGSDLLPSQDSEWYIKESNSMTTFWKHQSLRQSWSTSILSNLIESFFFSRTVLLREI